MKPFAPFVLLITLCFVACSDSSGISSNPDAILISGKDGKKVSVTLADLEKLPRTTLRAKDRGDGEYEFEGVEMRHVLKFAGAAFADTMKGKAYASSYLLVRCAGGFQTLFSLVELDPSFTDNVILLAFRRDGQPIPEGDGPFRIVVPHEKRRARAARQVRGLQVKELR